MKTLKYITLMLTCVFCLTNLQGQVTVTIENLKNEENSCTFDVYLHTEQAINSFQLGHSDFVFDLIDQDLQRVTFEKIQNPEAQLIQAGYCNFSAETEEGYYSQLMQMTYFNNTSCMVKDGKLFINVASPAVSDQNALLINTALIDGKRSAHRLGKFQISGLQDKVDKDEIRLLVNVPLHSTKLFEFEKSEKFPQRRVESVYQGETETQVTLPKINNTNLLDKGGLQLKVFPNPTSDFINIETGTDINKEVQIVNQLGQVVHHEGMKNGQSVYKIDLHDWSAGVYFVVVTGNEKQETMKFEKSE